MFALGDVLRHYSCSSEPFIFGPLSRSIPYRHAIIVHLPTSIVCMRIFVLHRPLSPYRWVIFLIGRGGTTVDVHFS
jgi:hypothetical protein